MPQPLKDHTNRSPEKTETEFKGKHIPYPNRIKKSEGGGLLTLSR